ncbi:MAG TPA: hypothetical protein VE685_01220 [Thermoanaerobaculia bacterium]|nr:hypothetical protein [Thermoanaerobaculia bacterium]
MRRQKKENVTNEQAPVQPSEPSHGQNEPDLDSEARFKARADLGSREEGLRLLDELDWAGPEMRQSIIEGMNTPIEDCEEDLDW